MLEKTRKFRDAIKNIDFTLIALTVLTAVFGIVMISSAGGDGAVRYVIVQSAALVLGLIGVVIISILDYDYLARLSKYIYAACIILLVLVLIPGLGRVQNGARSWFVLGPVSFQPAELVLTAPCRNRTGRYGYIWGCSASANRLSARFRTRSGQSDPRCHRTLWCNQVPYCVRLFSRSYRSTYSQNFCLLYTSPSPRDA